VAAEPAPTPTPSPSVPATARPSGATAAAHLREADAYAEKGNRIKELFHLQQAVRIEPGNTVALYRLGRALLEDGQADLGCEKLARAIQLGSKPSESLYDSSGCGTSAPH
jgi:tetratricopeptide (TPR) repeat protein